MMGERAITLFVPESLKSEGSLWKRYVISPAAVHLRHEGGVRSGEIYVFCRRTASFYGSIRCILPEIFPGCAVLEDADLSDERKLCALPDGCLRVTAAEHFGAGRHSHVKLTVG